MVLEWFVKADGQATPSPRGPEPDLWGAERGGGGGELGLRLGTVLAAKNRAWGRGRWVGLRLRGWTGSQGTTLGAGSAGWDPTSVT